MTFSSSSFMADKSESPTITPKKISSRSKFYKQQQQHKPLPSQCEHKENDGSEKGRRFSFYHRPPAAAGKSFLSPKCIKSFASAVRSPLIRFSPKKILGDKNNAHSKEHVADDATLLKEVDTVRRLSSFTVDEDIAGTDQNKQAEEAEEIKHAVSPVVDETIPRADWQQLVDKDQMSSPELVTPNSHLQQQHLDDTFYGKVSLKEMIFLEEQENLSGVTEDYTLNGHSTQRFDTLCDKDRRKHTTFVEYLDSLSDVNDGHSLNNLPTQSLKHGRAGLKHGDDDPHSGCTFAFTESCRSAADAFGSNMTHLRNELVESENEISSKSLVAKEEDCDTTHEAVFAGLFEARDDDHPQSTATARLFPTKMFALLLCFAAVLFLTCRRPQLLSSLVHQSPLPRLWLDNSYGEQMKILLKGTEGLWIGSQLTYSPYPTFQGHQLQRKVKIAVAVLRKNLQSVEISSKVISTWRFVNKKVVRHLHGKSSQKGTEQLWRYLSSTISKINKDICSGIFQKLSEHWKNQMPMVQHLKTISGFRNRLAEHLKARNFLAGIERMTTQLNKVYNSLKNRLVAIIIPLEEVSKSIKNQLVQRFEAQDFQASVKKWKRGLVDCVSSSSAMRNSLLRRLHSNYEVVLKHINVRYENAKKLVIIEDVTRTPAEVKNEDILLPAVEEWDWFSEYDIPSNEYLESSDASDNTLADFNYLSQLDELLSGLVHGESEEIKARYYLDLLHVMESDEDVYAVEDVELPSSKQPVDGGVARANDHCHSETWEEELLSSKCAISNNNSNLRFDLNEAPIFENLSTSQFTEILDDKMHIGMESMEVDDTEIEAGELLKIPAGDDSRISQLPRFDLHHQAVGISSANSKEQTFLVKNLNIPSLVSFQFEHPKLNIPCQAFEPPKFSNDIFYVLTILVTFTSLAYYIYFHYNLPQGKKDTSFRGQSVEIKDESPKWKELKMQTPKPKKMETRRINATSRFSTYECLKAKNMIKNRSK